MRTISLEKAVLGGLPAKQERWGGVSPSPAENRWLQVLPRDFRSVPGFGGGGHGRLGCCLTVH